MLGREVLLFTRLVLTEVPNGENQRRGLPRRLKGGQTLITDQGLTPIRDY